MFYRNYGKRIIDILIASLLLILSAPLLIVISLLIRRKLGAPIMFKQERPGLNGKPFTIYKFRTMLDEYDANGQLLSDESRLTDFGKLLRSTSLDELPEIWNVLRGEMSMIGPRPLLKRYLERYSETQMRRHEVCPGITGWAQVNGRNAISWSERFELDVWYVDNLSFILDVNILLLTVGAVIQRRGITQPGHATIIEFMGNEEGSNNL